MYLYFWMFCPGKLKYHLGKLKFCLVTRFDEWPQGGQSPVKQECIPVGCVPPAAVVVRGVYLVWGGVPGPGGCTWFPGGVPGPGGVVPGPMGVGVSGPGGCTWSGGVPGPGGCLTWSWGGVSQHALRQTHPPVNRITDACENITLPQLRCGR